MDLEKHGINLLLKKYVWLYRSSPAEVFLQKDILKICSKLTGEHPCRTVISIKLQSSFIEITVRHGCSPVNFLHNFRTPFLKMLLESAFGFRELCFIKTMRTREISSRVKFLISAWVEKNLCHIRVSTRGESNIFFTLFHPRVKLHFK